MWPIATDLSPAQVLLTLLKNRTIFTCGGMEIMTPENIASVYGVPVAVERLGQHSRNRAPLSLRILEGTQGKALDAELHMFLEPRG